MLSPASFGRENCTNLASNVTLQGLYRPRAATCATAWVQKEVLEMGTAAEDILRGFAKALESRDVEKTVGFFSQDAVYETPNGTFRGSAEIRRYFQWMFTTNSEIRVTETGVGILSAGDKAAFEHVLRGTFGGQKWEMPILCTYELGEGKIRRMLTVYDRLSLAKQVGKGVVAQKAVGAVIKAAEKGLH
jgi:ketosteroid isomerase-like protein